MPHLKEVFLYIGAPKCGSTFLFSKLQEDHIKTQLDTEGFYFINTFETILDDMHEKERHGRYEPNIFNYQLREDIFHDDILKCYCNELINQIQNSNQPRHIIIQENFSLLALIKPDFTKRLVEFVLNPLKSRFLVKVFLFIRPQSKLIESLYTQQVRFGLKKGIDQYFSELNLEWFSWIKHKELFSTVSSSGEIDIVPFVPHIIKKAYGKNFAELFLAYCNINTSIPDEAINNVFNPSCMPELLDLQIYANKTLSQKLAFHVNLNISRDFPRPFNNRHSLLNQSDLDLLINLFDSENKSLITQVAAWCPLTSFSIEY